VPEYQGTLDSDGEETNRTQKLWRNLFAYHTLKGRYTAERLFDFSVYPSSYLQASDYANVTRREEQVRAEASPDASRVFGGLNQSVSLQQSV
jgi:hypothetical protein